HTASFARNWIVPSPCEPTPIDPYTVLPQDVLNSQEAFSQLLAKCYQGLSCSGSYGPDGGPDIDGVDGGYGQYIRALMHLEELSTDVCTCCWNDQTLFDIHNLCWGTSDTFVAAMYYRIFFQVSLCNEFIRKANEAQFNGFPNKENYIAEARALRLLSYYHAIDLFGNVPFTTEDNTVGSAGPEMKKRKDLFEWMCSEAESLIKGNSLAEVGKNEYGRIDKGAVMMILAKLYLNAEIWAGVNMYKQCAEMAETVIASYPSLHANYAELFCADNHLFSRNATYNGDELIFVSPQDGNNIRSYGSTNYLIFASTFSVDGFPGKTMDVAKVGISSGWSGLSLTGTFTSKFEEGDSRAMFFKGDFEQYIDEIRDASGASNGWKSMKYSNINHDGSAAQAQGFVDTDFPVFRVADAYLMYAECAARGAADVTKGLKYLNVVRKRAGISEYSNSADLNLQNIIDERGRELYLEGFRRQDLIRFDMFTTDKYMWEFKGGVKDGKAVDSHLNLYPIPSADLNANGNLKQNPGY
ncbi:MAG: RagB/SusD family nutrient uptake outer membrane protein, partial [Bacteroidales bacterium]|nr:RagB/SusD family nutrient uptake outer membrane protein [Bacteroidales bacterium]